MWKEVYPIIAKESNQTGMPILSLLVLTHSSITWPMQILKPIKKHQNESL